MLTAGLCHHHTRHGRSPENYLCWETKVPCTACLWRDLLQAGAVALRHCCLMNRPLAPGNTWYPFPVLPLAFQVPLDKLCLPSLCLSFSSFPSISLCRVPLTTCMLSTWPRLGLGRCAQTDGCTALVERRGVGGSSPV